MHRNGLKGVPNLHGNLLQFSNAHVPALETELELLTSICLGKYARRFDLPSAASGLVNWTRVLALCERHRITPLAADRLLALPNLSLPSYVRDALAQAQRAAAFKYLAQSAAARRVVEMLDGHKIPSLLIKGLAVATIFYTERPSSKVSRDIDILVDARQFADADALLRKNGYERVMPAFDVPKAGESMLLRLVHAFEYRHTQDGHYLELHHRLTADPYARTPPFDVLLARASTVVIADRPLRTLGSDDQAIYLCTHAATSGFARLKWVADIARVLDSLAPEGRLDLRRRALDRGCIRQIDFASYFLELLGGKEAPAGVSRNRRMRRLARAALRAIHRQEQVGRFSWRDIPSDLDMTGFEMSLATGARAKAFGLLKHLTNQDDVRTLGLGVEWSLVYGILGRPLALRRYLQRRIRIASGSTS